MSKPLPSHGPTQSPEPTPGPSSLTDSPGPRSAPLSRGGDRRSRRARGSPSPEGLSPQSRLRLVPCASLEAGTTAEDGPSEGALPSPAWPHGPRMTLPEARARCPEMRVLNPSPSRTPDRAPMGLAAKAGAQCRFPGPSGREPPRVTACPRGPEWPGLLPGWDRCGTRGPQCRDGRWGPGAAAGQRVWAGPLQAGEGPLTQGTQGTQASPVRSPPGNQGM